jgi:hypothetical protein
MYEAVMYEAQVLEHFGVEIADLSGSSVVVVMRHETSTDVTMV